MDVLKVEVNHLFVVNKNKVLIHDLSFKCTVGIYAIIGQNGSGKTTLLKTLVGILPIRSGQISFIGHDLKRNSIKAKSMISYIPDKPLAYSFMTGTDYLDLLASCKGHKDTAEINQHIEMFGISKYLNTKFSEMSLGTQRKFTIIGAMIGRPQVIIMDEPLNGLDIESQKTFVHYINNQKLDKTIIFTSHSENFLNEMNPEKIVLS